jgi:hypothetical protein
MNGPVEGVFSQKLRDDIENEGGMPDLEIKISNLNEAAIKAWWDNYKKTNPKFRGLSNNCSTTVKNAFDAGKGRSHVPDYGQGFLYWDPNAVLKYGQYLQQAGQGIYVEAPDKQGWVK